MKLEDLRDETPGQICVFIPRFPGVQIPLTFHDYSIKAFYYSCQSLEQLEQSQIQINSGSTTVVAIGFWFITIEAYINAILKIGCTLAGQGFNEYRGKSLKQRLDGILNLLGEDLSVFHRTGITQRLNEFMAFRNEIFHDRYLDEPLTFSKTAFSRVPFLANQVDVVQAALIALEVFLAFRKVYVGLDLMPDIIVQVEDTCGFEKYDSLYAEVIIPLFKRALEKHDLDSSVIIQPSFVPVKPATFAQLEDCQPLIRTTPQVEFSPSLERTSYGADLFSRVRQRIFSRFENISEQFFIPTYAEDGLVERYKSTQQP
ncbi:MAG TPA: hypothetical protein V6D18_05325 [Thermosynechococcaceae cyanobacterium]